MMTPGLRKFALTIHIGSSVGLLGAIACFLALAITGVIGEDGTSARAAYQSMDLTARLVILPLAFAALLSGVIQSLGTQWGLIRHYWVLIKLLLTASATLVLVVQMEQIATMAEAAAGAALSGADHRDARMSLVAHAGGGLLVLLFAMVLSVYKPRGRTGLGRESARFPA